MLPENLKLTSLQSEALLQSLQVGVLLVRQRIVMWTNQSFLDLMGYEREDLIGNTTRVYFQSDEDYESIQTQGYPLLNDSKVFRTEMALRHKSGRSIWCHITANVIDANDPAQGIICSFADISDRVSAERLAREVKDDSIRMLVKQEAIFRSLQVGIMHAKDRKVAWGNDRLFSILGFAREELLDQSTRVYFRNDEEYQHISVLGYPLLLSGKPFSTEYPFVRRDGREIICHVIGNAIDLNDLSAGFIWSFLDITDRVEAEARARESLEREHLMEAEKMAALGVVVAGVAHEINTPIGVSFTMVTHFKSETRKFVELFHSGAMKRSDLEHYVDLAGETSAQLVTNITRAAALVQSFKRIAVDQSRDDQREFSLHEYLHEIVTSLMPTVRKTVHRISVECAQDIMMHSFPGALSQVVSNLIMNAMTHAFDEGQAGNMRIIAERKGAHVLLQFADDGKGILPEHLPKIFDPFFTTRRGAGGSGLGLNIVFNLVTQKLRGRVSCESMPGNGAIFLIDMPLQLDADPLQGGAQLAAP
ncbi:hypothetical protein BH11PSE11_BH11PSE11_29330 [soil metagenome]